MFQILFGWRKASLCKRLIKRFQLRLEVMKNKRDSIIRQLQQDVVQLIKTGHHCAALSRIDQIHRDQTIKAVYDMLHSFSEFIIINLSYIRKHRDCPNDINEAVSTLLYASARFGDLPELTKLRKLFGERYGQTFATTAVELLHGNLVNRQIIENLSMKSASDDLKLNLLKNIARDNGIQIDHHEINGVLELQWKQKSDTDDGIDAPKLLQISYEKEVNEVAKSTKSFDVQGGSDRVLSCNSNQIHSVDIKNHEEPGPLREAQADNSSSPGQTNPARNSPSELSSSPLSHTLERITEVEPETQSHFSERHLVYLDYPDDKEKSLLMVKSSIMSVPQNPAAITANLARAHQDHEKSRSQGATKRKKSSRRRMKRRYVLGENSSMKDVEAALYYGESYDLSPYDNLFSPADTPNSLFIKSQKKPAAATSPYFYGDRYPNAKCCKEIGKHNISCKSKSDQRNCIVNGVTDCSLENPCYFYCSSDEAFSTGNKTSQKACGVEINNATSKVMEEAEVIDCRRSCPSSHDSSRVASPWGQIKAPYVRAMTMPTERTQENTSHPIVRSGSRLPEHHNQLNIGSRSYVHPKLPEYGDLSARLY